MIEQGFCISCGRRFDADPDRPHDELMHDDCRRHSFPKILKNLGISPDNLKKVLEGQEILTTVNYWDCECNKNFIHPKSKKMCYECGAHAEEQPDSRVSEVLIAGFLLEEGSNSASSSE